MPNQIIPVLWGKPLRKSEVNTLDKVNELVDFINNSDIHELDLIASDQGREIVTGTSTQLAQLEVYGESVQNGTPTPDNPVPVHVVGAYNDLNMAAYAYDSSYAAVSNLFESGLTLTVTEAGYARTQTRTPITGFIVGQQYTLTATKSDSAFGAMLMTTQGGGTLHNAGVTFTAEQDSYYLRFYKANASVGDTCTYTGVGINKGSRDTYAQRGCIELQKNETPTPIDLLGHVLAELQNDVRDELTINGAGVKEIVQRVGVADLGSLNWTYQANNSRFVSTSAIPGAKPTGGGNINSNLLSSDFTSASPDYVTGIYKGEFIALGATDTLIRAQTNRFTDAAAFKTAMSGVLLYYPLATPTRIELGTIDLPAIPSGSIVKIVATLQPEFTLTWFTENGLPLAINDMRDYVDAKINEVNARIDVLHGITRANIEVQSIPVDDFKTEKTKNENTEVTDNER